MPAALEEPERPRLASDVRLIGELQGAGFADRQWLIQRGGRFIQVSELLYRVAEHLDGERALPEVARRVTEATDWLVTADNVRQILQTKLVPLGLVVSGDGSPAPRVEQRGRSPLQVALRRNVLGPGMLGPITDALRVLYALPVLVLVLLAAAIAHGWLYLVHGVADSARAVLYTPGGLLVVLAVALVASVFHELGHAAALRYGGGEVRGMGVGLYLVYPTLYTDTTDAYRLGRWARLRTDLGGMYFHLVFALGLMALYLVWRQEVLLAVVLLINVDMLYQLLPYVRLDGYWALADLTGIPDFFSQMGPFLRSVLRIPGGGSKLPRLKRWAAAVFAVYIGLAVPALALLFFLMVRNLPHFLAVGWGSLLYQTQVFFLAQRNGDLLTLAAVAAQMLVLGLALLAAVYLVYSASRAPVRALWNWSQPTPARRAAGALAGAGGLALLAFVWAPQVSLAGRSVPAGVVRYPVEERLHVQAPVAYAQTPPVGGNHAPLWQNCGFYDAPIASENAVHSLEHGAVWITYQPDLAPKQVDLLRRLARRQTYVLVSPYSNLPAPVVASAWGHQLGLDSADDPRLNQFVRAFRLGPQAPEREGPCTGGTGTPR